MTKIRAVVVDDEKLARDLIREYLASHGIVEVVGECGDPKEAVELVDSVKPDLLFLDIQMPGVDGFGVLEALSHVPVVIFSTAYDRYAIKAFEVSAVDYLLKPYTQERFDRAVARALKDLDRRAEPGAWTDRIQRLLEDFKREKPLERVLVRQAGRIVILSVSEIDWAEAMDDYVGLHAGEETYLVKVTMSSLERRLEPRQFVRVHRSTLVNLAAVEEIYEWSQGRYRLVLKTGKELALSRTGAQRLKDMSL